ncbi:MAG: Undecaprenyl-phosphate galactose phosphotransferase [Verrucomicrobia bacterium]|nr:Undecaprenyl-phosphate galactose phosphotransferase [Verrucomicrobiota bacterium]
MRSARFSAGSTPSVSLPPAAVIPSRPIPHGKRISDIVFCLTALPFLALATLFMTVLMRIVSPGPVFFYQERVGYLGRRFRCYKFRTMKVDADANLHRAHAEELIRTNVPWVKMDQRRDTRLIPGARMIRAVGFDELPQLINVLRGDMSLIGPRPCLPYEYEQTVPWQRERFSTLPGLTGLWQVSGKNRTTFDEMIRLDIHYAQRKTWLLDLKILLLTFPALAQQVREASVQPPPVSSGSRSAPRLEPLSATVQSR